MLIAEGQHQRNPRILSHRPSLSYKRLPVHLEMSDSKQKPRLVLLLLTLGLLLLSFSTLSIAVILSLFFFFLWDTASQQWTCFVFLGLHFRWCAFFSRPEGSSLSSSYSLLLVCIIRLRTSSALHFHLICVQNHLQPFYIWLMVSVYLLHMIIKYDKKKHPHCLSPFRLRVVNRPTMSCCSSADK